MENIFLNKPLSDRLLSYDKNYNNDNRNNDRNNKKNNIKANSINQNNNNKDYNITIFSKLYNSNFLKKDYHNIKVIQFKKYNSRLIDKSVHRRRKCLRVSKLLSTTKSYYNKFFIGKEYIKTRYGYRLWYFVYIYIGKDKSRDNIYSLIFVEDSECTLEQLKKNCDKYCSWVDNYITKVEELKIQNKKITSVHLESLRVLIASDYPELYEYYKSYKEKIDIITLKQHKKKSLNEYNEKKEISYFLRIEEIENSVKVEFKNFKYDGILNNNNNAVLVLFDIFNVDLENNQKEWIKNNLKKVIIEDGFNVNMIYDKKEEYDLDLFNEEIYYPVSFKIMELRKIIIQKQLRRFNIKREFIYL